MKVVQSEEKHFSQLNINRIPYDDTYSQDSFYLIIDETKYPILKFSSQSQFVKPILLSINNQYYALGIDLVFCIFDNKGCLKLSLVLDFFFIDTKVNESFIYVLTELEIIKISIDDFIVRQIISLPDVLEDITFSDNLIKIKYFGTNNYETFDYL